MVTNITVGEEFTLFREKHFNLMDGCVLEALEDRDGFLMTIYLNNMSREEKDLLNHRTIKTRMIKNGNKVLFITRYGDSPLMFEASFDPTLYKDLRAMQITFENHMVTFVGVERATNEVQTLRMANFPMKLKQALITAWSSAYEDENYSMKYANWVQSLYRYDMFQLWEMAEDVGYFGEKGYLE